MATTNQLVNNYIDFFKEKFIIEHLDGADEIITPFTDNLNDFISVYIERNDDGTLTLTDNGNTIDELELLGLEWNTKTRKKMLNSILINYGVELDENNRMFIRSTESDFSIKKHGFIQAILKVNDLLFTKRSNVINLFNDEVWDFLYEHEFGGSENIDMTGKSGLVYKVDYTLGATKKRPEIIMQFMNRPSFDSITTQEYIYQDISEVRMTRSKKSLDYFVIVNDIENSIPNKVETVIQNSNLKLIRWSNKDELLSLVD